MCKSSVDLHSFVGSKPEITAFTPLKTLRVNLFIQNYIQKHMKHTKYTKLMRHLSTIRHNDEVQGSPLMITSKRTLDRHECTFLALFVISNSEYIVILWVWVGILDVSSRFITMKQKT